MRNLRYSKILRSGLTVVGLGCALSAAQAASGATLWYNGDYDLNNAATNESNVPVNVGGSTITEKSLVYDNFTVPTGQSWSITSLFSDDQVAYYTAPTKATWEIRSGMSAGSGGTLVASGDSTATVSLIHAADGNNYIDTADKISETITAVVLPAGNYWMAISPDSNGYYGDQSYIETTSGTNAVGLPAGNDGNSFINNNLTGPGKVTFAASGLDYSAGVVGTATLVPEPTNAAMLAAGIAGVIWLSRRRHRLAVSQTA